MQSCRLQEQEACLWCHQHVAPECLAWRSVRLVALVLMVNFTLKQSKHGFYTEAPQPCRYIKILIFTQFHADLFLFFSTCGANLVKALGRLELIRSCENILISIFQRGRTMRKWLRWLMVFQDVLRDIKIF